MQSEREPDTFKLSSLITGAKNGLTVPRKAEKLSQWLSKYVSKMPAFTCLLERVALLQGSE